MSEEILTEERKKYLETLQKVGSALLHRKILDRVLSPIKVEEKEGEDVVKIEINRAQFYSVALEISRMHPNPLIAVETEDVKKALLEILTQYMRGSLI